MPVVVGLDRRINPYLQRYFFDFAVLAANDKRDILAWLHSMLQTGDIERLGAVQSQGLSACSVVELTRYDAHPDQIAPVHALDAPGHDRCDTQAPRDFGCPIARTSGSVLLAGEDHQ